MKEFKNINGRSKLPGYVTTQLKKIFGWYKNEMSHFTIESVYSEDDGEHTELRFVFWKIESDGNKTICDVVDFEAGKACHDYIVKNNKIGSF